MPVFVSTGATAGTAGHLIEETRKHLGAPETLNTIEAVDATATTVTLARTLRNVSAGTLLSVGLETMYVWDVIDTSARTLEVRRGHANTVAVEHDAGELVRVAPDHTDFEILRAINAELRALYGTGLFAMRTTDLTTSATGVRTYTLPADAMDVYDVLVDYDLNANTWPRVSSWTWLPDLPASEFADGKALRLDSAVPSDRPLRVLYKAAFTPLEFDTDDVEEVTGLRASAHDILPLGAAWRLTAGDEVERNQTRRQGDSRRAQEVPSGAKLRSSLGLQGARQQRIREELLAQARLYPSRSR